MPDMTSHCLLSLMCVWLVGSRRTLASKTYGARDICGGESFQARCDADEVIVMQRAVYGRMSIGRCVKVDMGYIGCSEDVLDLADGKCSGKQECDIAIPDSMFETKQPCLELQSYLEASYSCLKVLPVDIAQCRRSKYLRVTQPTGYIASALSFTTWCGTSSDTPWLIEALPGQRINITLLDFGVYTPEGDSSYGESFNGVEVCQKYAVVREKIPERSTVLCGGRARERQVYLSNSNSVEIGIEARSATKHHFLLKYEVLGCADPPITSNTGFKRENNEITIRCKDSNEVWRMTCVGTRWIGKFGNCSRGSDRPINNKISLGRGSLPKNIVIVTVCGIAFVVGVLILMIGIFFFRKYKHRPNEEHPERRQCRPSGPPKPKDETEIHIRVEEEMGKPPGGHCKNKEHVHYKERRKPEENHNTGSPMYQKGMVKNDYTHIWEMPLPTPEEMST